MRAASRIPLQWVKACPSAALELGAVPAGDRRNMRRLLVRSLPKSRVNAGCQPRRRRRAGRSVSRDALRPRPSGSMRSEFRWTQIGEIGPQLEKLELIVGAGLEWRSLGWAPWPVT